MAIIVIGKDMPEGCQKCREFMKIMFGNGLDYEYRCRKGAKDFPMPWIRQENERASDCPLKSLDGLIQKMGLVAKELNNPSEFLGMYIAINIILEYCEEV